MLTKSESAFHEWKQKSVKQRAHRMRKLAGIFDAKDPQITQLPTLEMGKLHRETIGWEMSICSQIANYYAKNAQKFLASKTLKRSLITGTTTVEKHPLGSLLGIMPWNYPYYQVMRFAVPNIMAGNTVIIKHASNVPQCALALEKMFRDAGFPEGVYTNIMVSGSNTSAVIANPRIKGVSLTGSESVGATVASVAGQHLKKVVLELGGSDPMIVLDDIDLEYATDLAMMGRFFNSGQTCIASKRIIVHQNIHNPFMGMLEQKIQHLWPGDPMHKATNFAPLSSQRAVTELEGQVKMAVSQGAELIKTTTKFPKQGAWFAPCLLTQITLKMSIHTQELFGPVALVYQAKNDEDAIAIANDSPYGLSSVIVGKNTTRIKHIENNLETGMCFINSTSITEPDLPFGGVKNSGFGRELAAMGMEEFINHKTIRKIPTWAFKHVLKQLRKQ